MTQVEYSRDINITTENILVTLGKGEIAKPSNEKWNAAVLQDLIFKDR